MKKNVALLPVALVLALLAACTTAPMVHPQPIAVPAGLSLQQVGSAVSKALIGRGWVITGSTANSYDARLARADWNVNIRTAFDTRQVTIQYLSSEGLKYNPTAGTINRHWNTWMLYLSQDIRALLSGEAYGGR